VISRRAMDPRTREEWIHYQSRIVDRAVDLLSGLVEEHGPELAFSRQSPELGLVVNLVGLVHEAGGSVATDALRSRLRRRLADDLGGEELATALGDLGFRIRDVGDASGSGQAHGAPPWT
jgi:hypothetical protein